MTVSEPNLRIPGPTPLPPSVREAGGRQMINHRGPEFAALLARVVTGGFELFADPDHASPTVSCVRVPADLDWKPVNAEVRRRRVILAGGQGRLAGQVFRVGHLGWVSVDDVRSAVEVIGDVLREQGR